MNLFEYVIANQNQIFSLLIEHIKLTAISVGLAILVGVPLGVLICYIKKLNKPVLAAANIVQAIPSMALLGFAIPFLGIGTLPAVVTVILYSLLPIIKNTYTGIGNIDPQTLEAARGIGLTKLQILTKVQIPLALPVIMAGVRISAVTAVGLMTMAAFIGAGGLGQLVFAGIRTVNNNQILAGAIPACILALLIDFIIAMVEKMVTPVSLQKNGNTSASKKGHAGKIIIGITAVVVIFAFIFTAVTGRINNEKIITLGSKDYTEQAILGNLTAEMIEGNTDISIDRKFDLGGTQVCFGALTGGDIDMYIEYSGSAYSDTLKYTPISDIQEVYDTVKNDFKEQYNIDTLKQMAFNNTYTMAVTQETAAKYNLKTVSDLAKFADKLSAGTTFEFANRGDGLPGMEKLYGFKMKDSVTLDGAGRYVALNNDEVDVIDAFSTDGLLKKFTLVTLEDDKSFFPPYYPMPIIRNEVTEEYPEIIPILEKMGDCLTNEIMIELNYKVDELQQEPREVAREFLLEQQLIQ